MIANLWKKSRVTEVSATTTRLVGAYKNTSLDSDVHLTSIMTPIEALLNRMNVSINRTKTQSILDDKDGVRDDKVRALGYLVTGYTYHPNAQIKSAALQIENIFNKYGLAIVGDSYATESALIVSLLGDLADPDLQEAIARLSGLDTVIAELQTAQTEFETARIAYEEERAQEGGQENASDLKDEILELINKQLVVYLNAMQQLAPETYDAFARTVATIIDDNNEAVKRRNQKTTETD